MSSANKIITRFFISLLFSVYLIFLLKTFFSLSKLSIILTGVIVFAASYYVVGLLISGINKKSNLKWAAILGAGMAALLMIASPKSVNPGNVPQVIGYVKVTALGEKNEKAHASEVWIKGITTGGTSVNMSTIPLSPDWDEKYHQLASFRKQPATQEISIQYAGPYEIEFLTHEWSGKVKIEDGTNTTIVDLYKQETSSSYKYVSKSFFPVKNQAGSGSNFGLTAITFLALGTFWFLIFAYIQAKNNYFLVPIALSPFVFLLTDYYPLTYTGKFLGLAAGIGAYFLTRKMSLKDYANAFTVKEKAFFILVILYGTFAFTGHQVFLVGYPVRDLGHKLIYFILFGAWLAFMSIAFLYMTEQLRNKLSANNIGANTAQKIQSPAKLFFTFFGLMAACWLVYFAAFFPGNMSADSLDQWAQATGIIPLNNWHPVFHTLFNKLCLTVYKSPASIALAQIIFMAAVMAGFLLFLSQQGLPAKWLKWVALIIGLIPVNGIMSVTLWKDVPFSVSLVWLTLVLAKIITREGYLKQKWAYVEITLALITAGLFRHNGIPVYILAVLGLLAWYFKTRKSILLVCVSLSLVFMAGYFTYISSPARVIPNPPAIKLVAPVHGLAAVKYYNGNLPGEAAQEMEKILPDSTWRSFYRPFSADEYIFFTQKPFVANLSKVPTSKVMSLYLNTLAKNPYLVIRDRLNGTEVVWNVMEANGSFNFRFGHDLDPNPWGLKSPDNTLKKVLVHILDISVKEVDPILWRAGLYNFLLLLVLLLLAKRNKWFLLFFIPVIGTNISLMLSMTLQNFRYVYYVPMIFGFIWLLSISTIMAREKTKTNYQN